MQLNALKKTGCKRIFIDKLGAAIPIARSRYPRGLETGSAGARVKGLVDLVDALLFALADIRIIPSLRVPPAPADTVDEVIEFLRG
jgi:hypothetical protein